MLKLFSFLGFKFKWDHYKTLKILSILIMFSNEEVGSFLCGLEGFLGLILGGSFLTEGLRQGRYYVCWNKRKQVFLVRQLFWWGCRPKLHPLCLLQHGVLRVALGVIFIPASRKKIACGRFRTSPGNSMSFSSVDISIGWNSSTWPYPRAREVREWV